jgi:hypothetical protein
MTLHASSSGGISRRDALQRLGGIGPAGIVPGLGMSLEKTHYYRFHITDPIYFDESLRASIEHGHNNNLTLNLRSVAYCYQKEPHKPFPPLPSAEEREPKPGISPRDTQRWRQEWRQGPAARTCGTASASRAAARAARTVRRRRLRSFRRTNRACFETECRALVR